MAYRGAAAAGYGRGGQQQDPMYQYFVAVSGHDGQISPEKLQACLTQANFFGCYQPFNLETCRQIIRTLDRNMSGSMDFNEFKEMWTALYLWKQHFLISDKDRNGLIDLQEINLALSSLGYRLNSQTMSCIMKRFGYNGYISFDDYVACCVKLLNLSYQFRQRMQTQQEIASFQYEDFIQCIMKI